MKFSGFIKTSLIDYPDTLASVVYLSNCNFNCGFCHNSDLVKGLPSDIDEEVIFNHLEKRKNIIDGLVVTGGEPTLHKELITFLRKARKKNIKIKLDTNGYKPEILEQIFNENLVDYVAMDIKNSQKKYLETISINKMNYDNILKSVKNIKSADIDYEFRTTLMKEFHSESDIEAIGMLINGAKKFVFQQYQYSEKQIKEYDYKYFTIAEMEIFKKNLEMKFEIKKIEIRGKF